jgi:hypothetical protein
LAARVQAAKFKEFKVSALLKGLLKERLHGQAYDPVRGSQLAKQMAGDEGASAARWLSMHCPSMPSSHT